MIPLEPIQLMAGIFCTFAFVLVAVIQKRYSLDQGPWLILSLVSLFLTLGMLVPEEVDLSTQFTTIGFIFLALLALIKFYDFMGVTQRPRYGG